MKNLISICGILLALSFTISFILSPVNGQEKGKRDAKKEANKIFKKRCIGCHGRDGKGTRLGKRLGVPNFTDPKWQKLQKDEELIKIITNGRKRMPKFGGKLTKEQIKTLVKERIRGFNPSKEKKDDK